MKQKILEKLKAIRDLKATSITDKTLEAYADLIAIGITEESQIDTEVVKYENVMVVSNGNISFTAAEAIKLKQAEWEAAKTPPTEPLVPKTPKTEEKPIAMTAEDIERLIEAGISKGLAPLQQAKKNEQIIIDAQKLISERFGITEAEKAMSNYIFNNIARKGDLVDAETLVTSFESEYNGFRAGQGLGTVPPKSNQIDLDKTADDAWQKSVRDKREAAAAKEKAANDRINN